ncbi:MAG TPA: tetratricopeptide repeat protein [Bacteroidia bacterium]|nr:tetratricopeptide repeat protein [Bacteroidia bacterium]
MKKILFLAFLFIWVCQPLIAQKHKKPSRLQEDLLGSAEYFFDDGQYSRALPYFQKLIEADSTNAYYHYKIGICYLHNSEAKLKSISELETAQRINPSLPDMKLFLGMAYHLNNKFDEAIDLFNRFLSENPSPTKKKLASHYIEYCQNGKILVQRPMEADIINTGAPVNTAADEYAPVISSDETTLIFTYKGERSKGGLMDEDFNPDPEGDYYEDIFISQRVGKDWLTPESISDNINTKGHDASIALSSDGQTLFIFKSSEKDKGDIYMSTLKGDQWTEPQRLGPNINSNNSWEGSCSITSDGQLLYFASDRKGGYGGRDIYVSQKQKDGEWGPAKNLGPAVNTEYDDDAPFIHPDGIDLFFSSKGHNSMGGYDIMYSTKREGIWSDPINLGYPLNTTEDERYYVLTASGEFGYFSSDRAGGSGGQDIYTVSPGFQGERPVLALVVGTVTVNDKPADSRVRVTNVTTGQEQGLYNSNSASGKYLVALTPGNEYKVAIEVDGLDPHIEYVNVKSIETFVQVTDDIKMYSPGNPNYKKVAVADSSNTLQAKIDQQIAKYRSEQNYGVYEALTYKKIMTVHGEDRRDSVDFNVELGRFECPQDFDSTHILSMGHLQSKVDFENATIFYVGPYKTLLDAELVRQKALKLDTSIHYSAVTVNDHGVRKTAQKYFAADYKRKDYIPPVNTILQKCKTQAAAVAASTDPQMKNLVKDHGNFKAEGLSYKLELAVVKDEKDFDPTPFAKYGKVEKKKYADGTIHYSMGPYGTLSEAAAAKDSMVARNAAAAKSVVMVLDFGKPKTVQQYFEEHKEPVVVKKDPEVVKQTPVVIQEGPCISDTLINFTAFVGLDLNVKENYAKLIATAGRLCSEQLSFTVQIGAYRHPENFKHKNLISLEPPPANVKPFADGITRFTMREFKTLQEAEAFRQKCIALGTKDAWITASYKGERKLLQDCIANNFWGKAIN